MVSSLVSGVSTPWAVAASADGSVSSTLADDWIRPEQAPVGGKRAAAMIRALCLDASTCCGSGGVRCSPSVLRLVSFANRLQASTEADLGSTGLPSPAAAALANTSGFNRVFVLLVNGSEASCPLGCCESFGDGNGGSAERADLVRGVAGPDSLEVFALLWERLAAEDGVDESTGRGGAFEPSFGFLDLLLGVRRSSS